MSIFHDPVADQSTVRGAGPFLSSLNDQWRQIRHSRASRRTVARWGRTHPVLAPATDPHDILLMIDQATLTRKDELFTALILLAQDGQDLASRILLQAMLPKLSRMAGTSRLGFPIEDRRQLIVGAFWEAVAAIRVENRHGRLAGQLALDAYNRISTTRCKEDAVDPDQLPRKGRWVSVPDQDGVDAVHDQARLYPDKDSDLDEILEWMLRGKKLSDDEVSLMQRVYLPPEPGHTQETIAADLQISFPALRKRCSRITAKIRTEIAVLHPHLADRATPSPARTPIAA